MPTLLIVEDEAVLARNLEKAFAKQGFEVRGAASLAEGRAVFAESPPDVVLLDLRLPDGRQIRYSYDSAGNVTSITPPGRPAHAFTYTPVDLEEDYVPPDVGAGTNLTRRLPDNQIWQK